MRWLDIALKPFTCNGQSASGLILPLRIVMIPLSEQQVAEKIRKAKSDRDKRLNHSKDYYLWLGYNVFTTNVGDDVLDAPKIAKAYAVRWQIEILFKLWKSGPGLQKYCMTTVLGRNKHIPYADVVLFNS